MSAASKLARLETALEVLERAAGLHPDIEVIEVGQTPKTDAPVVVERIRFAPVRHAIPPHEDVARKPLIGLAGPDGADRTRPDDARRDGEMPC